MSTVKITELTEKTLAPNISNTIFVGVDLESGVTGKYTAKDLADNLYANNILNVGNTISFVDGTTQNTSFIASGTYANAAFLMANASYGSQNTTGTYANAAFSVANTPTHVANSAALYANGAFAKANAALANTSGTFDGDLNISGSLKTSGEVAINNSSFLSNTALISITASDNFATVAPSNTNYMLHITGKANSTTRVVLDSFGVATYPLLSGRMGRGSASTPAAVANNDIMMRIVGNGYTGTQFPSSSPTKIDFIASENFSDTNRGTRIEFWNTPVGSNTIQKIATFNADVASFSGYLSPSKGFVFTPRLPEGSQTAITIDYTTDSIIKANLVSDLTISHTNFIAGKVVEVWLVNTGGQNRTVTHGLSALNSTTKSTTFTITASSATYMRFFSIDGDLANTFVTTTS
jgi:hypothetical protein